MRKTTTLVLCGVLLIALIAGFVAPQVYAKKFLHDCYYSELDEGTLYMCCVVEDPDCLCSYEECYFVLLPTPVEED